MNPEKMEQPDLLFAQLCELYFFENQLVGGLLRLAEAASNPQLKALFLEHREETMGQVRRLEEAFTVLGAVPKAFPTLIVDGLMEDARWRIHTVAKGPGLDDALMAAARLTEALEVAMYRNLVHTARERGQEQVASLCVKNLQEEMIAEQAVVEMAEGRTNNGHGGDGAAKRMVSTAG